MKSLIVFLLLCSCIHISFTQSWIKTDTLPPSNRYDDVYFISNDIGWTVNREGQIFKTTNGGAEWRQVNKGMPEPYLRSIEFINESIGFAGSLSGTLMRTVDGGESWYHIEDSIPHPIEGICGLAHIGDHVFGVGVWDEPAYFIKSTDQGVTWTYKDLSEFGDAMVDCYFIDEMTGFIGGSDFGVGSVILKTTDGGETWENVFTSPGNFDYVWKLFFVNETIAYGAIESLAGVSKFAKTTDGGNTWVEKEGPPGNHDIQGIGFDTPLHGWICPRFSPFFETHDGGETWEQGAGIPNINRIFQAPNGDLYASGSQVYKYTFTTGNEDYEAPVYFHQLSLSPNPFSSSFTIHISLDYRTEVKVGIAPIEGREFIHIYNGVLNGGNHTFEVHESQLREIDSQLMIVVLATDEGMLVEKVIRVK